MTLPSRRKTFRIFLVVSIIVFLALFLRLEVRYGFHIKATIHKDVFKVVIHNLTMNAPSHNAKPSNHSNAAISGSGTHKSPHYTLPRGQYIKVGTKDIAIITAVHHSYKPSREGFNIILNGWAHIRPDLSFKCCVQLDSANNSLVEVPSKKYHIYKQWIVDMQNAEFSCSIPTKLMKSLMSSPKNEPFRYVTFVERSCLKAPRAVIPIEYRKTIPNSVGICLKISYGTMNTELMVEWFEYQKLMGVTRVFSFLAEDLDEDARKVFQYYAKTGFAEVNPIHPAPKNNGTKRSFRRPRWEHQAWVDEVTAISDCRHRMAGMDWVIIHDIDEWIVPKAKGDNIVTIFKKAAKQFPKAASFQLNSHAAVLNWGDARSSPLNVMRTTNVTTFVNYDGADRNARFAWNSDKIKFASNNIVTPTKGRKVKDLPDKLYTMIHRRSCKPLWKECNRTDIRTREETILRYEPQLIRNIGELPLDSLLPQASQYILRIRDWIKTNDLLRSNSTES